MSCRSHLTRMIVLVGLLTALAPGVLAQEPDDTPPAADAASLEFFEKSIRPLLIERCVSCHGPDKAKNDLRLDTRQAAFEGGITGPAIVAGELDESLIIEAVRFEGSLKMPPKGKLSDPEIAALEKWVSTGAAWPAGAEEDGSTARSPRTPNLSADEMARRATHWSFRPVAHSVPPQPQNPAWCANPVDAFLLPKIEASGLSPAPETDRRTLIRRMTYDMTGLPPTPAEIEVFLADDRPTAVDRLIDRLMASPHFGERWGRHWLDLVRYGDTSGHEFDYDIPNAWRYRDYVIDALNADVPYDQFVREHIAGDLLENPRRDLTTGRNLSILATGFSFLGEGVHSPVDLREEQVRRIDNQLDVFGKTFLGLTLACARCHDHKFDPITQRDYYALAGFFVSSRYQQAPLDDQASQAARNALCEAQAALRLDPLFQAWLGGQAGQAAGTATSADVCFADFDGPDFGGWAPSGHAFGARPSTDRDFRLTRVGQKPAVQSVPPGVAHSGRESDRLRGTLRSPSFTINSNHVRYLAWGRGGRVNLVVDGFEKIREPIYGPLTFVVNSPDAPQWFVQDVHMWRGQRAYIELSDGTTVDFGGSQSHLTDRDAFLAVDGIWFTDSTDVPALPSYSLAPRVVDTSVGSAATLERVDRALELSEAMPDVALALSLADGTGEDEHLLTRGNPRTPAAEVPRRFLELIAGDHPLADPHAGSGRLELAERLLDPADPLPARVIANRLWQHHFGRGLTPTPDDFGHMGKPPTHPELLDWLANEVVGGQWSLKHVHRLLLRSQAYRMASQPQPEAVEIDPDNQLFHRASLRRLEAEPLRDALLSLSGRLDPTMHGPGVMPFLSSSMDGRGRPDHSGPLDGAGRRTVYLSVRRNFLSPFLLSFDFPTPASPMGRRNRSNVPAQALTLLNDPFILQQAEGWARRTLAEPGLSTTQRIDRMFVEAFGRPPTPDEQQTAQTLLTDGAEARWAELAHVLLNVKEFSFVP